MTIMSEPNYAQRPGSSTDVKREMKKASVHEGWIDRLEAEIKAKHHANHALLHTIHSKQQQLQRAKAQKETAESELKRAQTILYDQTKNIKVTDDDFSTIIAKLGKFSGKLSNFPPNSKSSFKKDLPKQDVVDFFVEHSKPEEKEAIQQLFKQEPSRTDYALVAVLVEKLITQDIVRTVYKAPIHLDQDVNKAFKAVEELYLRAGHEDWVKDLRLRMSKATVDCIHHDALHETTIKSLETRNALIERLVEQLSVIYDNKPDIKTRIEKLVDMAIDLSLPIRGQEDLLEIRELKQGDAIIRNQVKPLYRHLNSPQIMLGVSPVFLAISTIDEEYNNEEEENSYIPGYTLVYQGKAIW